MQQSFARLHLGGHQDRGLERVHVNENLPRGHPDDDNDPINLRRQLAYVDDSSDEELGNVLVEQRRDYPSATAVAMVENFFEYMEIPEERQVKLVAYKLKGDVILAVPRLQAGLQPYRSLSDYTEEFYRLNARNNLSETENQQVMRYIGGLGLPIQDQIAFHTVWNLSEAVNLAYKAESQLSRAPAKTPSTSRSVSDSSRAAPDQGKQFNPPVVQHQQASRPINPCDPVQTKQPAISQPHHNNNPYERPTNDKCYRCNQPGHRSNTCPTRRQANLVNGTEDDPADFGNEGSDDYGDQSDDEVVKVVEGDHGDRSRGLGN
ncbi:hypothetical protein RHGRI_033010 [Rhododendron griersonianum]|uniref:CCHC-type domain-containing protein n=1 Tax=Rhododendron griersonianum TaxID=479676 RepID=A0AAV6HYE1_9ERIC|nr:hypothetical protein RHGRI_033010 [Rhododendron griersonianum]